MHISAKEDPKKYYELERLRLNESIHTIEDERIPELKKKYARYIILTYVAIYIVFFFIFYNQYFSFAELTDRHFYTALRFGFLGGAMFILIFGFLFYLPHTLSLRCESEVSDKRTSARDDKVRLQLIDIREKVSNLTVDHLESAKDEILDDLQKMSIYIVPTESGH